MNQIICQIIIINEVNGSGEDNNIEKISFYFIVKYKI